jgi:hypothetical protein
MAILKSRPDLEVTIDVDGQPLEEHNDGDFDESNEDEYEMRKYIASVPGAKFAIHIRCANRLFDGIRYSLGVDIVLDGVSARRYLIKEDNYRDRNDTVIMGSHMKEGETWFRNYFTFSELEKGKPNIS